MIAAVEWRGALRDRRLFAFNVLVPLALVLPIALSGAPRAHAAAVYTLLVVFFGVFGNAIPLVRDSEQGLFARVLLAGAEPATMLPGRVLACAAIDLVQLLPTLIVIAATGGANPVATAALFAGAACALVAANALGTWVALGGKSIAEAALLGAVASLLALHFAGVFRGPPPGGLLELAARLDPFTYLHAAVRAVLGLPTAHGPLVAVAGAAACAAGMLAVTALAARTIARTLARATQP